jgi:hypothetical protein
MGGYPRTARVHSVRTRGRAGVRRLCGRCVGASVPGDVPVLLVAVIGDMSPSGLGGRSAGFFPRSQVKRHRRVAAVSCCAAYKSP